jgi:aldehyde:ferredoxin oxidoreductase
LRKPVLLHQCQEVFNGFITFGRMSSKNFSGIFEAARVYPDDIARSAQPCTVSAVRGAVWNRLNPSGEEAHGMESWSPLEQCLIANPEAMQEAYSLCNRFGLDTISAGAVVSFAFECFENGLITREDTGGIELTWGNHQAVLELLKKMSRREGIGDLLAEGVKIAAERIGGTAPEYAMHVKGVEVSGT